MTEKENVKVDLRELECGERDNIQLAQGQVVSFCKHNKEPLSLYKQGVSWPVSFEGILCCMELGLVRQNV
jgi:hypothetical protein